MMNRVIILAYECDNPACGYQVPMTRYNWQLIDDPKPRKCPKCRRSAIRRSKELGRPRKVAQALEPREAAKCPRGAMSDSVDKEELIRCDVWRATTEEEHMWTDVELMHVGLFGKKRP
jgi:hypothetical protein